jgi:hypothetical protein
MTRHDVLELLYGPTRQAHALEIDAAIEEIRRSDNRTFTIKDSRRMIVLTTNQAIAINDIVCQGKEINFNGAVFVHRDGESTTWRLLRGDLMIGGIITFEKSQITKLPEKLKLAEILLTRLRQETQTHGWRACGIADDIVHPTMLCISSTEVKNAPDHNMSRHNGLYVYSPTTFVEPDIIMLHSTLIPASTTRLSSILQCMSSVTVCGEPIVYEPKTVTLLIHEPEDIRREIHTLIANPNEPEAVKNYLFSVLFGALPAADQDQIRQDYPDFFRAYPAF